MIAELLLASVLAVSADVPVQPVQTVTEEYLVGDVVESTADVARSLGKRLEASPSITKVKLTIDSYGGDVPAMNVYLDMMDRQKSRGVEFECSVDSKAMSAAAQILMNCNKAYAAPRAIILFHVGSVGMRKVDPKLDKYYYKLVAESFNDHIMSVLNKEERADLLKGEDVMLSGKTFMERLSK